MSKIKCFNCGKIGIFLGIKWYWKSPSSNKTYYSKGVENKIILICEGCGIILRHKKNSDFI